MISNGQTANADEVLAGYGAPLAQSAYEQVKSDSSSWTNTDYLGADIFTSAAGAKSTVDTGNSTSIFLTDNYNNGEEYTSGKLSSFANTGSGTVKTGVKLTMNRNEYIKSIFIDDGGDSTKLYITDSSLTVLTTENIGSHSAYTPFEVVLTTPLKVDSGSTYYILVDKSGSSYNWHSNNSVTYPISTWSTYFTLIAGYNGGDTSSALLNIDKISFGITNSSTVETNTIINEVVPDSIVVYGKTTLPTNTSITVDVSDDGGSTWGLTSQSLNTAIDTSSFTTGNLALKFNLATTDTSVTPKLYGYGIAITDI